MKPLFTRTKIICTIGPASGAPETLRQLINAGMDVARLNFSHGTHEQHQALLDAVRSASATVGEPVAIMQDLGGPKIRIGSFSTPSVDVQTGGKFCLTTENITGDIHRVSTTYEALPNDVQEGDTVLLDDGKLRLTVERVEGNDVHCVVAVGGTLSAHKGMNLPGVRLSVPSLTVKDRADLEFAFKNNLDYVALSFVRSAEDITLLRENNEQAGYHDPLCKIEKPEAIAAIDAIIGEADAIMVARGDLGVELPVEEVPLLQKMIVRKCNEQGKPVIIATQMLETMVNSPTPTRAEASDVANAVLDGADAVMLSGETSVGKYPVQTAEVMERILRSTEEHGRANRTFDPDRLPLTHEYDPLTRSACLLARSVEASTIVAITHSGETALHLAKFRPPARIIAITDQETVIRKLNLVWGIRGMLVDNLKNDTDRMFTIIRKRLLAGGLVHAGEKVVSVAGLPFFESHRTNTIKVDTV